MKLITILGVIGLIASTGGRLQGLSWSQILLNMAVFATVTCISCWLDIQAEKRKRAARRKSRRSSPQQINN